MADPILESDLLGYVDEQLDIGRRIEVEDYLARHPEVAARVMADLRARDALRLALSSPMRRPPAATLDAARRLERGLVWRRIQARLRRVAAVSLLIGLGWVAHDQIGLSPTDSAAGTHPPAIVEEALHARQAALVRARMASQKTLPIYDTAEILSATGIALPDLPRDWRVADVQVFPARDGTSVEVVAEAPSLGRVSLFAAHGDGFGVTAPTPVASRSERTVYWQAGPTAYVLTGSAEQPALEQAAKKLFATHP